MEPRLRWQRLAWCFGLLVVMASAAMLLAVGSLACAVAEWNDPTKLGCSLGLLCAVPLLVALLVAMIPYAVWISRERSWMHPGLLRSVSWTWWIATALTAGAVATLALVSAHPGIPPAQVDLSRLFGC